MRYPTTCTLPHDLVGMVERDQIHQLARSGWGFSPDQMWEKRTYAQQGEPETPPFLVAIIEDLVARNILAHGDYPGSEGEAAKLNAPAAVPSTGRWSKVTDALAASFHEPEFRVADDASVADFIGDAQEQGMAIFLVADADASLVEHCRLVHDHRVGWSHEDILRMDELVFTWDDQGMTGRVDDGLKAYDAYLQQRGTGKRLVSVDVAPEMFVSLLVAEEHVDTVIAGLAEQGLYAGLQDAAPANRATALAGAPVADAQSPLVGVTPRMERMPMGAPGQVAPMSAMNMDAGGVSMPGRVFSHEIGVIFVLPDGVIVTSDHLEAAGVDEDELLDLAIENFTAHLSNLSIAGTGPERMLTGLGGLEACVALVPSFWDQMAAEFPTGPVIAAPSKDVLIFTDSGDANGIKSLRSSFSLLQQNAVDGLLGESLYTRGPDGSWVVFDEVSHSAATSPAPPKKKRFWNR